jgi:hypothetical protein
VKVEGPLRAEALRILRDIPGVTAVRAEPTLPSGKRPDALIHFAGKTEKVIVEVKRHANAATAWQLLEYAKELPGARLLLVATGTTKEARDILERHGVGVVDGLGNAHLELPGLLIHVEGDRRRQRPAGEQPPARLTGKAGVAAQALLLDPARDWRVMDLAEAARISAGLAHRVLARLEGEGLLAVEGTGPRRVRRLVNATALLDLWVEENRDRHVTRCLAFRLAPDPRQLGTAVATALDDAGVEYAVTGAQAAIHVAPFVTAVPVVEVWVTAAIPLDDVAEAARAEPVATGHNLVLQQVEGDGPLGFRQRTDDMWRVNDFRLYYDLRNDPRRGREQADQVRTEVIGF